MTDELEMEYFCNAVFELGNVGFHARGMTVEEIDWVDEQPSPIITDEQVATKVAELKAADGIEV